MDTVIRALQWSSSRKRLSDTRAEEAPANRTELEILREEIEIQVRSELAAHAQKLYDTERARAYVEGHAFGVTEAKIAAEKELARTREDSEAKVASALAALEQAHQAASSKLESSVGEVAFAAVCRLVGRQATSQAFVLGLVGQTCRQSRTETSATVRMHPRDLDTLRDRIQDHELRIRSLGLTVIPDESLKFGGCVIEATSGHFDGGIETQLRRLHDVLVGAEA